jgi:hypothetical protein
MRKTPSTVSSHGDQVVVRIFDTIAFLTITHFQIGCFSLGSVHELMRCAAVWETREHASCEPSFALVMNECDLSAQNKDAFVLYRMTVIEGGR